MSDIINYPNKDIISINLRNLSLIFFMVKEFTDKILINYSKNSYIKDPSVNVISVAKSKGIKKIQYVSPEKTSGKRALLTADNKILVNKKNSKKEQLFSIAHELAHYIKIDKIINTKIINVELLNKMYKKTGLLNLEYGRSDVTLPPEIINKLDENERNMYIVATIFIAKFVSKKIGRNVSLKKANVHLSEVIFSYIEENKHNEKQINLKKILFEAVNKTIEEEITDYFAANLLVPTERFILWEDKPDKLIAHAFKVNEDCIKKRREEIKYELDFTMPINFSSDVRIENIASLPLEEQNHLLEGQRNHDNGMD